MFAEPPDEEYELQMARTMLDEGGKPAQAPFAGRGGLQQTEGEAGNLEGRGGKAGEGRIQPDGGASRERKRNIWSMEGVILGESRSEPPARCTSTKRSRFRFIQLGQ